MSLVRRVYVEKKAFAAVKAAALAEEIKSFLHPDRLAGVRILIRYDTENITDEVYEEALNCVYSEPPLDDLYEEELPGTDGTVFSVEALPGQYDQRADSCAQALRLLGAPDEVLVRTATTYLLTGDLTEEEVEKIRAHVCNPVDSRVTTEEKPDTLAMTYEPPAHIRKIDGFIRMDDTQLKDLLTSLQLAMTAEDLLWIRDDFRKRERRDPTMTELRVLDTYWSDHCRHTTFATKITDVTFDGGPYAARMQKAYQSYLDARQIICEDPVKREEKPVCLMDIATAGMKYLKAKGLLTDMEESEENNACTIIVPVTVTDEATGNETTEEWLLFFKNETHNHPTEIEPFGGAATCLGGAIRDPLSGRGYVYQAMRITGAADPTGSMEDTLPGKLPQKKIVKEAAAGYSSYGNQIGLATGYVREIYHPGYVAKRMEIGSVMGAAPRKNVRRESPVPGDKIILCGGRTGRDGIGGATGSSKAHTASSIDTCGAEVQKGNAPTERKIQRLFRREEVIRLIKKCNDFGAGGVSVAIGELAESLDIDLDKVPKKYEGLDGTELAISESQERMAVVVADKDEETFIRYCAEENLEAVTVARVTDTGRLVMRWRGEVIVDLSRAFLDTNGAPQCTQVRVPSPDDHHNVLRQTAAQGVPAALEKDDVRTAVLETLRDLNVCSQRGLVEMFDASIGASSVTMPFGGATQMTPVQTMSALFPVLKGTTSCMSMMSYGFDPYLSSWSPYHGAHYAILHSVAKICASGADPSGLHFTFQEYFGKTSGDPASWGAPFAALLGAFEAQLAYGCAAIGGKDSMSGTFGSISVPPTLVSFAVAVGDAAQIVTPEFKKASSFLVLFEIEKDEEMVPRHREALAMYGEVHRLMREKKILSCYAADAYGLAAALNIMSFGNELGVTVDKSVSVQELFENLTGSLVAEVDAAHLIDALRVHGARKIGTVTKDKRFVYENCEILQPEALQVFNSRLEKVYPVSASSRKDKVDFPAAGERSVYICRHRHARPRVFIPLFPGTNCEYDLTRAFASAGADVSSRVFCNMKNEDIRESVRLFRKEIDQAQILMFPGGFSAGDEPDGSAKFFAAAFRNEEIAGAVMRLLEDRDGLALGICNGFQAMIKLGLLPGGRIEQQTKRSPTLTYNTIGRHVSRMAHLRVIDTHSPWLALCKKDEVYTSPVSHGEGRFVGDEDVIQKLFENGQVATLYADPKGNVTMDDLYNLNGSYCSIEGITSPDGRCYGKMAHAERKGAHVQVNVPGEQDMRLFEAGVRYFSEGKEA